MKTSQQIAKEIILNHCQRHNFEYEWFFKKWGNKAAKVYNGVHLDWHKQILCLYIKDNMKITSTELAELLGYRDHSTVVLNLQKFRALFQQNDDTIHERYAEIASWADDYLEEVLNTPCLTE